eukprot:SAG22_NODE_4004_length_1428_cov_2.422122_2_plen_149_part_01
MGVHGRVRAHHVDVSAEATHRPWHPAESGADCAAEAVAAEADDVRCGRGGAADHHKFSSGRGVAGCELEGITTGSVHLVPAHYHRPGSGIGGRGWSAVDASVAPSRSAGVGGRRRPADPSRRIAQLQVSARARSVTAVTERSEVAASEL